MKSNRSNPLFSALALTGATSLEALPVLGQITVANAAQNYAGSLAQDVQGYLAGLPSSDEMTRLELLFPGVQTNDFFQFAKADDEAYLTEGDNSDIRAIGASFKRVQYKGTTVTDSTQQKGLTMRVDHKTLPKIGGTIVAGWENRYADALRKRLIRADIVRGLALVDAAANNTAITFSASTNPDGLLRAQAQRSRVALGQLANTIFVIGNASWQGRVDAYEAASRVNTGVVNHSDYDEAELARYLGVKTVHIADGIKQTAKGATKTNVLGLLNYSYSTSDSPILDDPSNVRRAWSPVKGGGEWAVAIQEYDVFTDITVWHESKIFIPFTAGIEKTTVTIA
jgi:hypothetical protein